MNFVPHAHIMLDDNVVKTLAQCVVETNAKVCVEVGSFIGTGSTIILAGLMAARDGTLYCVDRFDIDLFRFQGVKRSHYEQFIINISAMGFSKVVHALKGESTAIAVRTSQLGADLIYIDSAHTKQAVVADIKAWLPHLRPGGIICGDDYNTNHHGVAVSQAVHMMFPSHHSLGRFWWAIKGDVVEVSNTGQVTTASD